MNRKGKLMENSKFSYLGDGVYVETTEDGISLFTHGTCENDNLAIYLGKESTSALFQFISENAESIMSLRS